MTLKPQSSVMVCFFHNQDNSLWFLIEFCSFLEKTKYYIIVYFVFVFVLFCFFFLFFCFFVFCFLFFAYVSWEGSWQNEARKTHEAIPGRIEVEEHEEFRYTIRLCGEDEGSSNAVKDALSCP